MYHQQTHVVCYGFCVTWYSFVVVVIVAVPRATVVMWCQSIRLDRFWQAYIVFVKCVLREYRFDSFFLRIFFFWRNSGDRSSKSIDDPCEGCPVNTRERGRRDDRPPRWEIVQVGADRWREWSPASRGGWLVGRSKVWVCSCRREADRDGGGMAEKTRIQLECTYCPAYWVFCLSTVCSCYRSNITYR